MKRIIKCLVLTAIGFAPGAALANNVVLDSSFEVPNSGGAFTTIGIGGNVDGWTVTGAPVGVVTGSVDQIHDYWQAQAGTHSLDLNGNEPGGIDRSVGTTAGQKYLLTFYLSGNPDGPPTLKVVDVNWGGSQVGAFTYDTLTMGNTHGDMKWQKETLLLTAAGPATDLSFVSGIPGPYGAALDSIKVTAVPTPTAAIGGGLLLVISALLVRKGASLRSL